VLAVLFAAAAGFVFGLMPLGVRHGLKQAPDVMAGTVAQCVVGLAVCGAAAVALGEVEGNVGVFVLLGLLVPGLSTMLLTQAVREAGPSRASVLMNAAPLLSITMALVLLDEPFHPALVAGAVLIVGGAVWLAGERDRPEHVRTIGLVLAVLTGMSFAVRDNLVRWLSVDTSVAPQLAGSATLAGAAAVSAAAIALQPTRGAWRSRLGAAFPAFAPAGIVLGVAYITMYEAFFRGRVGVVSPMLATAAFWGVILPWFFLRNIELVGRRLFVAAVLIVAGGVLIGIFK
jgi:drug/metabolite transporter (DMT)-like permease